MRVRLLFAMLIVLTLATVARAAPIIYDNGGPNQQNGNEMTEWIQTEEFTLTANANLTDIHFWDLELPTSYNGAITFWILPDLNGNPNFTSPVTFGVDHAVGRTMGQCGILGIYCEFSDQIDLNTAIPLLAGVTYHLALHNGTIDQNARSEFYWETTSNVDSEAGLECDLQVIGTPCYLGDGSAYSSNGQEHAFYLTGTTVPEPGTLVMLGTGILGLAGTLRRKL